MCDSVVQDMSKHIIHVATLPHHYIFDLDLSDTDAVSGLTFTK